MQKTCEKTAEAGKSVFCEKPNNRRVTNALRSANLRRRGAYNYGGLIGYINGPPVGENRWRRTDAVSYTHLTLPTIYSV